MIVQGYVSVFNVQDKHLDTMSPVAFDKFVAETDLSKQLLPLMMAHEPPYMGFATDLEIHENHGLWASFEIFPTRRPIVSDLFASGRDIGFSIGYECTEHASECTKEGEQRILRGVVVREVSLVSHPANPETWATISRRDEFLREMVSLPHHWGKRMARRLTSRNGDQAS